jgi:competence protein ComEC
MMCALPELDSMRRLRSPLFLLFSSHLFLLRLFSVTFLGLALGSCLVLAPPANAGAAAGTDAGALHVYFIDVEGGQATLFVTPAHESLLIDTGWPGNDGRDADRIVATAKRAGLSKIDYVLITHFHTDHGGGVPQLTARIPVGTFIDHGVNRESSDKPTVAVWEAYQKVLTSRKFKHIVAKPGDDLPIHGSNVKVVSSDGELIG